MLDFLTTFAVLLVAGIGCGIVMSAPVGPMGTLALMRMAKGKTREARLIALGAVGGDVSVAMAMSLGLGILDTLVHQLLPAWLVQTGVIWAIVGVALLILAIRVARLPVQEAAFVDGDTHGRSWAVISLMFTLGHPGGYASFAAAFAWLHSVVYRMPDSNTWLVALVPPVGVAMGGGAFWYVFLAAGRRLMRYVSARTMLNGLRALLAVMLGVMAVLALYYACTGSL